MRLQLSNDFTLNRGLLLCFAIGFLIRSVPEVLALSCPIGFDTIYYAAEMKNSVIWPNWSTFFTSSWLLYALVKPLYVLFSIEPFLLLKVLGPVLFGLNIAGVYWFSRELLFWNSGLSLATGAFFGLQLASLRISWDLLRNELGMAILLFALPFIRKLDSKHGFACFILLSLLAVFAHEYAGITLVLIVSGILVWRFVKKRVDADLKRLLTASVPAFTVFAVGIFLRIFPIRYTVATGANILNAGDVINPHPGGLFFLVDYLHVQSAVDFYASYWSLALNVLLLFALLYLSYLLMVWKGFFKNEILSVWTAFLLIGAFGCLFVPFCALEYWHRWMFMLAYPFTFYAVRGLGVLFERFDGGHPQPRLDKKVKAMILTTVLLGSAYLLTPLLMVNANVSVPSLTSTPVYFSTSPTVPYQDVNSLVQAMQWLNQNVREGSVVILQHAFLSWGELYLDKSHWIVHFETDPDKAVEVCSNRGFGRMYFVWWNVNIGWYGVTVPNHFTRIQDFGRVSVYDYIGESLGGS